MSKGKSICLLEMFLLVMGLVTSPFDVWAEVYQWQDEHGQTHFGDSAPVGTNSDNISDQLEQINISTDFSSPEIMLQYEEQRAAKKIKKRQDIIEQKTKKPSVSQTCKNARQYLNLIEGRVVFMDKQGKEVKVSERQRKNRALEVKKLIRQKCRAK